MSYKFIKISDLSTSRVDAMDYCRSRAKKFLEHFDKIFIQPNDLYNVHHWCSEMQNWFNECSTLVLSYNKKLIKEKELINWFFEACSNVKYLFPNNENEQKTYVKFYKELLRIKNVEQALININLVKGE